MSEQGQSNYKGVNAQAWAAMSLFLQYLRYTDFSYIQLEAPAFEDFNLVFSDGHKIICESKDWKQEFGYSNLKKILTNILKKTIIGEKDEILIICTKLNDDLRSRVEHMKYGSQFMAPEFKKKGFSDQQITIMDKVKFWKVQQEDNHLIVYALFSELLGFWLPEDELECRADGILIKRIYEGSAKGRVYKREDIISEIDSMRKKASKYSGYFDDERVKTEVQLQNLIKAVNNNKAPEWAPNQLSALTSKPALMTFALDRIKDKKIDKLADWSDLWELYKIYRFSFTLFRIFEANLHTPENKEYVLQFFKDNISEIGRFYQRDFFNVDVVKITKKTLEDDKNNKFINKALEIVKKLITEKRDDIFYLKAQRDSSWERGEVAKLLKEIYLKADSKLKEEIYKLIINTFNLVKDDGSYSHYTPREIFEILHCWLGDDFKRNFRKITNKIISQFQELYGEYRKKEVFTGWELSGGITSGIGHRYTVGDRHFIGFILEPAIREYYDKSKNKEQVWNFILQNCISKTNGQVKNKVIKKIVGKNRPDFLNRAALPIVLERYKSGDKKISDEAFEILKEFILSRRGIPRKSDLIYQTLRDNSQILDDKKWKLVEVSMNKYGVPVNVFVEEIVSGLANKGNKEAKKALWDWLKNPEYYKKFRFEMNIIQNIRTIFDSDFEYAVSLFEQFISSEYFINKQDSFESYDVSRLLYDILKKEKDKDNNRGLEIIEQITKYKNLTKNQQIILCFSLFNYGGNDQSDNVDLLEMVYAKFIDPFLTNLGDDIDKIVARLSFSQAREAFVQFAERLARNKKIKEALRIVKVFVNDPDPYLPGKDPEDPENKYNEHQRIENGEEPHSITSTRGWCGWVLMKCSVLDGRDYIGQIIDLTEQLAKDKNWYVKHMACFALSQLAQNRLTVLPDNKNVLFFGKNTEEVLERSKRVEKITFDLLKEVATKASANVQKALAKSILTAFDHIRILNEKDALTFVNTFKNFTDEAVAEAAPLFIFFAEFRKDAYKDWRWKTDKYYNDLTPFDDKKFKKILLEVIDNLEAKQRFHFAAQFEHLLRNLNYNQDNAEELFEMAYKYLDYLAGEYNHELSNIIYMTIKNEMAKNRHFNEWYKLFLKYLKKEKEFYDKKFKQKDTIDMYWWPSLYNSEILMFIHNKVGKSKFLEALNIITQFPKEIDLNVNDNIVSLLDEFPKSNKTVKDIITRLFEKNPSKYYELRNKWLGE